MLKFSVAVFCGVANVAIAAESTFPVPVDAYGAYEPYREEPLKSWREVNDDVARIGGHAGIFREQARQSPALDALGTKPPSPAAPAIHGNHH